MFGQNWLCWFWIRNYWHQKPKGCQVSENHFWQIWCTQNLIAYCYSNMFSWWTSHSYVLYVVWYHTLYFSIWLKWFCLQILNVDTDCLIVILFVINSNYAFWTLKCVLKSLKQTVMCYAYLNIIHCVIMHLSGQQKHGSVLSRSLAEHEI